MQVIDLKEKQTEDLKDMFFEASCAVDQLSGRLEEMKINKRNVQMELLRRKEHDVASEPSAAQEPAT